MASLRKIRTAALSATDPINVALAATVALAIALGAATQARAQKGEASTDIVFDAVEICGLIINELETAEADLANDGWAVEYSEANGPFVWEIGASKIYADGSDAYIFALLETYPTGFIGYCSFDVQGVPGTLDLEAVAAEYDVVGTVEYNDIGAFGIWEEFADGGAYYVQARQDSADNYFFLQMTFIGTSDGTGGGGGGK